MAQEMDVYVQDLHARRATAAGTEKDAAAQHGKGRLTARERIDLLFDPGTFTEIDTLVLPRHETYPGGKGSRLGDGVITGFGLINGRRAFASSQDAAVMG
ncbi:MAG TPA: carboxyl transferase domain-containing protein, partial [Promineifilum sp.]|nr:carboxyl transferase domain-containing protein [Promineifilum sp.]